MNFDSVVSEIPSVGLKIEKEGNVCDCTMLITKDDLRCCEKDIFDISENNVVDENCVIEIVDKNSDEKEIKYGFAIKYIAVSDTTLNANIYYAILKNKKWHILKKSIENFNYIVPNSSDKYEFFILKNEESEEPYYTNIAKILNLTIDTFEEDDVNIPDQYKNYAKSYDFDELS